MIAVSVVCIWSKFHELDRFFVCEKPSVVSVRIYQICTVTFFLVDGQTDVVSRFIL